MEHVISLVEMVRSCYVYVPEAMVGTLTLILFWFLRIEYIEILPCCNWSFGMHDQLQVLMDT